MNDLLSTQLHASLHDVVPDLDHLADGAIALGRRRRRVRRAGFAVAGLTAVAGISIIGAQIVAGDSGPTVVKDAAWAAQNGSRELPDSAELQVGQVLDLDNGVTGTVTDEAAGLYVLGKSTQHGSGSGFVVIASGPKHAIDAWWTQGFGTLTSDYPGITLAVTMAEADALGALGMLDDAPATIPEGWTCVWTLQDDKADCESDDGGVAGLVIRDAAERPAWVNDPDKGDDASVYTTEAHGGIFISVQAGMGTTDVEVKDLGERLEWVD